MSFRKSGDDFFVERRGRERERDGLFVAVVKIVFIIVVPTGVRVSRRYFTISSLKRIDIFLHKREGHTNTGERCAVRLRTRGAEHRPIAGDPPWMRRVKPLLPVEALKRFKSTSVYSRRACRRKSAALRK